MTKIIPLTMGRVAIVDDEDYERLSKYNWRYDPDGYAIRNALSSERNGRPVYSIKMHREIIGAPKGFQVDHINGDSLDNRKANLRICTKTQNGQNRKKPLSGKSSQYKGVCKIKETGRWQAKIHVNHKSIYLGIYDAPEDAGKAYDKAALEYFGEYARLNFPEGVAL